MHLTHHRHATIAKRVVPLLAALRAARRNDIERISGTAIEDATLEELIAQRVLASINTPAGPLLTLGTRAGQGTRRPGPLAHALLAWGFHRAALRAAHLDDGFTVDDGPRGRRVLVGWLREQTNSVPLVQQALDRFATELTRVDEQLGRLTMLEARVDIAWRGTPSAPENLRILFVEHPFRALKAQLAQLPLDIHGLPPIDIVLRPQDDGSAVDKHTGRPLWKGPRWLRLERLFQETARPTSFPFWETARLVTYRPELFYRAEDPKTWNRWRQG